MDKLARALVKLRGLSVSNAEASEIRKLYNNLLEFDKKPLVFQPAVRQAPQGRFARSKGCSIVGMDHMKKYEHVKSVVGLLGLISLNASFQVAVQQPPLRRAEWLRLCASS